MTKRYSLLFLILLLSAVFAVGCSLPTEEEDDPTPTAEPVPIPVGGADAIKLQIDQNGMVHISAEALRDAGLALESLSPDNVALSHAGEPVPYAILDDGLVFYGQASDSDYDNYRHYIVSVNEAGETIVERQAGSTTDSNAVTTISQRLTLEENRIYEPRGLDETHPEVYYWHSIRSVGGETKATIPFNVTQPAAGSAEITFNLYGGSYDLKNDPDHDLDILINGTNIGKLEWDGQVHHSQTLTFDGSLLEDGANELVLDNSVPSQVLIDLIFFDSAELVYQSTPAAVNGAATVTQVDGIVGLTNFSQAPYLFEISNPSQPVLMSNPAFADGQLTFQAEEPMTYLAVEPGAFGTVARTQALRETTLTDNTNQADLLIVTTRALSSALAPLQEAREAQGISSVVAITDEIYDAFGNGEQSADSIQSFVRYTYANWAEPKPQYLLLVGDATTDTRGYLDADQPSNVVPSVLIPVNYSGQTVSDSRLADADGDNNPDLAVGRWPVATVADVESLVERTLAYEASVASPNAIFTAGANEDGTAASREFSSFIDRLIDDTEFPAETVDVLLAPPPGEVVDAWNDGAWLVGYVGHGSLDTWDRVQSFSVEQVTQLSENGSPPIVVQFTCLTGQFAHPEVESISETMLKHKNGPVLMVAATSLTLSTNQSPFANSLIAALQDPTVRTMGDAFQIAKLALNTENNPGIQEISDTFVLIGDPSAQIVRPDVLLSSNN